MSFFCLWGSWITVIPPPPYAAVFSQSLSLHVLKLTSYTVCVCVCARTFCLGCLHVFIHVFVFALCVRVCVREWVCVCPHTTTAPTTGRVGERGEVDHGAVNLMTSQALCRLAAAESWRVYKPAGSLSLSSSITEQRTTSRENPGDKLKTTHVRLPPLQPLNSWSVFRLQTRSEWIYDNLSNKFTVYSVRLECLCSSGGVMRGGRAG